MPEEEARLDCLQAAIQAAPRLRADVPTLATIHQQGVEVDGLIVSLVDAQQRVEESRGELRDSNRLDQVYLPYLSLIHI